MTAWRRLHIQQHTHQWRTMTPEEGGGAAARDTTSQQGPVWNPPAATGSGARRATAGLGGKRAEMAAPSTS